MSLSPRLIAAGTTLTAFGQVTLEPETDKFRIPFETVMLRDVPVEFAVQLAKVADVVLRVYV